MFGFQTGWANFKMGDLKDLNRIVHQNNPLNPVQTSNYPSYYYYQPTLKIKINKLSFGILYSKSSSGSRSSIKDFSGEYRFDTRISNTTYGILTSFNIYSWRNFNATFYSEFGFFKTKLNITEYLEIYNNKYIDFNNDYSSKNGYLEPGIILSYSLRFLEIEGNLGYFKQLKGKPLRDSNSLNISFNSTYDTQPDWSGFRYGLSLFFVINRKR